MTYRIIQGDCIEGMKTIADESVHCVVTSPPYYGLRDYGVDGQIGLEETPEAYVAKMVDVFREVRRILRSDGTVWLNLGDSYTGGGAGRNDGNHRADGRPGGMSSKATGVTHQRGNSGLKPKDLIGIPWRVAFALQADGWWLRQDIIWHKPNPMPESVTDRCTKSHEYIFLLTKSERYYYDAEAVKEKVDNMGQPRKFRDAKDKSELTMRQDNGRIYTPLEYRNKRSVWTVATKPYAEAHFAVYPTKLIEPCILAGTSAYGCCAKCGTPYERILEVTSPDGRSVTTTQGKNTKDKDGKSLMGNNMIDIGNRGSFNASRGLLAKSTSGWAVSCTCNADKVPCTVFDPFTGSGTTAYVALSHNRHYVGTELNPEYVALAENRLSAIQPRMELL